MTTLEALGPLWSFQSPAWWLAAVGLAAYGAAFRRRSGWSHWLCVLSAAAMFVIALASPVAVLAQTYLFSAHMVQHLLLLLIVPLLVLLSVPKHWVRSGGAPVKPVIWIGWMAGVTAMAIWHIPALCTASMQSPTVFGLQTASLLLMGTMFWWPIFGPAAARLDPPSAGAYLFTACLACTLIGIYLTFSPISVCPLYANTADPFQIRPVLQRAWGLDHAADRQLGGLLMWVPACMIYLAAIMAILARWYGVESPGRKRVATA